MAQAREQVQEWKSPVLERGAKHLVRTRVLRCGATALAERLFWAPHAAAAEWGEPAHKVTQLSASVPVRPAAVACLSPGEVQPELEVCW